MTRMLQRIWLSATLALAPSLAASTPVRAAPAADEADYVRDVVGRAAAHVEQRRYAEALAVLDQAERERPLPVFLYVRATIEERRGNCEGAVALYRRFLALDVPAKDAEDARRGVQRCEGEPALVPEPEVVPTPTTDPTTAQAPPSSDPSRADAPPPRPWYADPWGGALVGVGVVGVGVGVGLVAQSRIDARAADDATGLQTFDDRSLRAVALDRAGITTMAVGGALLVAGAIRYALVGTRERRRVALVPSPSRRGGSVRVIVRF